MWAKIIFLFEFYKNCCTNTVAVISKLNFARCFYYTITKSQFLMNFKLVYEL